jgi:ABC-type lipoprotein release transport system permease subunit
VSNVPYSDLSPVEFHPLVQSDDHGRKLASWELYMVNVQPIANAKKGEAPNHLLQLRGVDDPVISSEVHGMTLYDKGRWFSQAGVELAEKPDPAVLAALTAGVVGDLSSYSVVGLLDAGRRIQTGRLTQTYGQAVLGEGIARMLGADQKKESLEVGDTFDIGPKKWVVVGIMNSAGSTFDSEIWVKRGFAGPLFGKTGHTTCVLSTANAQTAAELATDLTANYKKSAVKASTETEYYDKLNTTNAQFLFAIAIVMFFMSIGGVVGVMIVMFAAISQRSKDIGVLRIVGFQGWQVLVSFFLESLLLAIIGGIIGCALGSLANGHTTTSLVGSGVGGGKTIVLRMTVDAGIILLGMLFALVMGCVGGIVPALFAMRVRPLESLR